MKLELSSLPTLVDFQCINCLIEVSALVFEFETMFDLFFDLKLKIMKSVSTRTHVFIYTFAKM